MWRALLLLLLLSGCGGGGSSSSSSGFPYPAAGQWAVAYGAQNTVIGAPSYYMPKAPGTHYVYTPASGLALGKTMTLTYTLTETAGTVLTHDDPADIDPPTVSLFIWQAGDNLSCAGAYAGYRQFLIARPNLTAGTHTVSAAITAANWTGCYPGESAAAFNSAVAGAAYMGFTLSGQYFAGHGVDVASGSATLSWSLSVQ